MFAIIAKKKTHSRLPTATHLNINLCSQDEARKMNRRVSRLCFSRAHGVVVSHPLRMRKALGSNPSVSIFAKRALMRKPFAAHAYSPTVKNDPGRTRTCNLWFRRPTPYPLGHRASQEQVLLANTTNHDIGREIRTSKKGRPWQDSNLQSLLRVTAREGVQEPMPYPFGHRVKRTGVGKKKRPWQDSNLHIWSHARHPHTQRAAGAAQLRHCWQEFQCLIHSATGSNTSKLRKKQRPWQDSNLQIW